MEYRITQRDIESQHRRERNLQEPGFPLKYLKLKRYQATLHEFTQCFQTLTESTCPIDHLELSQVNLNEKRCDLLADAIKNNSSVEVITINKCKLRKN